MLAQKAPAAESLTFRRDQWFSNVFLHASSFDSISNTYKELVYIIILLNQVSMCHFIIISYNLRTKRKSPAPVNLIKAILC